MYHEAFLECLKYLSAVWVFAVASRPGGSGRRLDGAGGRRGGVRVKELVGHHGVAQQINELKDRVVEAKHRRKRYKVANEVDPGTNNVLSIDPRLSALYVESSDLVGIDIPRDHLINMLDDGEQSLKKPDVKKILGVLLSQVKNQDCATTEIGDDNQLINALRSFLKNKRGPGSADIALNSWYSPPHVLRELYTPGCCFQRIPEWITSMVNLYRLCIRVKQVTQEVLNILGGLPSLLDLELRSEAVDEPMEMLSLRNTKFRCLKIFRLYGPIMGLMFEPGAVPQLEALSIEIRACQAQSTFADHLDLGIHHLASLRDLNVWINCGGAKVEEVEALVAAITHATNLLPNHPTPRFYRDNEEGMVKDDAHVEQDIKQQLGVIEMK
nr:unnamed protein product [Digitaria exilis]